MHYIISTIRIDRTVPQLIQTDRREQLQASLTVRDWAAGEAALEMLQPTRVPANDDERRDVGGLVRSGAESVNRSAPHAWAAFQFYRY